MLYVGENEHKNENNLKEEHFSYNGWFHRGDNARYQQAQNRIVFTAFTQYSI